MGHVSLSFCSCFRGVFELAANGWLVEPRPSLRDVEPAATDVVCVECAAVYRLTPRPTHEQLVAAYTGTNQ